MRLSRAGRVPSFSAPRRPSLQTPVSRSPCWTPPTVPTSRQWPPWNGRRQGGGDGGACKGRNACGTPKRPPMPIRRPSYPFLLHKRREGAWLSPRPRAWPGWWSSPPCTRTRSTAGCPSGSCSTTYVSAGGFGLGMGRGTPAGLRALMPHDGRLPGERAHEGPLTFPPFPLLLPLFVTDPVHNP